MQIIVHTDANDAQLTKAVRDAVEGEIVKMTREALSAILAEEVSKKVRIDVQDSYIREQIRSQVGTLLKELLTQKGMLYNGEKVLIPEVMNAIRSEVRDFMNKSIGKIL